MKKIDEITFMVNVKTLSASIFSGLKQLSYKGWITYDREVFKEKAHDVAVMQTAEASGAFTKVNDAIKIAKREIEREQDRQKRYLTIENDYGDADCETVTDEQVYQEWLRTHPKSSILEFCREHSNDLEKECGDHALRVIEWLAKGFTQEKIGAELDISHQAVSKIIKKIRIWLQKHPS